MAVHRVPVRAFFVLALLSCNEPPGQPVVGIEPPQPTTSDDLTVTILTESPDPDGDIVLYSYAWFQDNAPRDDVDGTSVPAELTAKGETWRVVATPSDGGEPGPTGDDEVVILNAPPSASVSIVTYSPSTEDPIEIVVETSDPDDDVVTLSYSWTVNGVDVDCEEPTLPAELSERGVVEVTVFSHDGEEHGTPATATVDVGNTPPVVESVSLSPAEAFESSTLTLETHVTDADDDEVTMELAWYVDGKLVQEGDPRTLTGEAFDKHQQVTVEATPHDGLTSGEPVTSEALTVLNSPPAITTATLDIETIYESSTVSCVPTGWSDDDGDEEGYRYGWTVDAAEVSTEASIDGTLFDKGQAVACMVTPNDGEDDGEPVTSLPVTVLNTAPTIASASLSTTSPVEGDTLSVTLEGVEDEDDDKVDIDYAWYVEGMLSGVSSTLSSATFGKGDEVWVEVTPNDDSGDGATVTSDTATVANSAPSVLAVVLSPSDPTTDSNIVASVTTTDPDGDAVSLSYLWTVDGAASSTTGGTLRGSSSFDKGQVVQVSVTPSDGEDDGSAYTSSTVTVQNTPPEAPTISIEPTEPKPGDQLQCVVEVESTDDDGDDIDYLFSWDVDGVTFGAATTTDYAGDTVSGSHVGEGETWTCTVTPDDGDSGSPDSATASITTGSASASGPYVYVAGFTSHDVWVVDVTADTLSQAFTCAASDGPRGLAVDDDGYVYLGLRNNGQGVERYTMDGTWVDEFAPGPIGNYGPALMRHADGELFVSTDYPTGEIERYDIATGALLDSFGHSATTTTIGTHAQDGYAWSTGYGTDDIIEYDLATIPAGVRRVTTSTGCSSTTRGITVGHNGNLFVFCTGSSGSIKQFDASSGSSYGTFASLASNGLDVIYDEVSGTYFAGGGSHVFQIDTSGTVIDSWYDAALGTAYGLAVWYE